jgi:hypothetical protein
MVEVPPYEDYINVMLCEDCTHAAYGSDVEPPIDTVPLSKIAGEARDLTANYCSDHYTGEDKPCGECDGQYGPEDDDGKHEFATFDCDGCESGLAGARYRFALWR